MLAELLVLVRRNVETKVKFNSINGNSYNNSRYIDFIVYILVTIGSLLILLRGRGVWSAGFGMSSTYYLFLFNIYPILKSYE